MSPHRSDILLNHFYWLVSHGGRGSLFIAVSVGGLGRLNPCFSNGIKHLTFLSIPAGHCAVKGTVLFFFFFESPHHNTPFALKYRSQCWTSRGVFFIVNQYWSICSLGVEYGSISHQAVEEIWFQLAREARSRFPSSGNSRHGNISQMDWYRLARTFLATEPAQGNFCHISLTQLGQAVKQKKKWGTTSVTLEV